ncbi:Coiled-coil domain-containing protein 77, partial [Nowakowskiella sp. JEL0407]
MSIADLPLSQDLLNYYRSRLEKSEADYAAAIAKIDSLQLSHEQFHKSQWELLKRESEINELQKELSDYKDFAFEERKKLLNVLAENDTLKIQELKDRKKIRYLLSISGTSPHETTYFRDQLDKRLVKIGKENAIPEEGRKRVKKDVQDKSAPEQHDQHKIHSADREVVILEDEIEGLKLTVLGLQTQLDEQRSFYGQSIAQLKRDKEFHFQEHQAWFEQQSQKCEELLDSNRKLRSLCRENTR